MCKKKDSAPRIPQTAQKIVIPRGMINPNETTIIEIPARLHDQPLVIAKRKLNSPAFTSEKINKGLESYEDESSFYPDDTTLNKSNFAPRPQQRFVHTPPDTYSGFAGPLNSSVREVSK